MADPISCLKLALNPGFLLSPIATPEFFGQCVAGKPTSTTVSQAVLETAGALITVGVAGKLARTAARFAGKAAARAAVGPKTAPTQDSPSAGKNTCISPYELGLRTLISPLFGAGQLLISPVGTPGSAAQLCTPDQDPFLKSSEDFVDGLTDAGADVLMETFGPGPALWLAETFGL